MSSDANANLEAAQLVRRRLVELKKSQRSIAERAGIHPSHLSLFLSGRRSLGSEKLVALAGILGLKRSDLLQAAGQDQTAAASIAPDPVAELRSVPPIKVVTDPRFIDSAVFLWACSTQRSRKYVNFEFLPTDWDRVPKEVAYQQHAVGFCNRRFMLSAQEPLKALYKGIHVWMDLCLYKGYAVLARKKDIDHCHSLKAGKEYIDRLAKRESAPTLLTVGGDTEWRVKSTPLVPSLKKYKVIVVNDPDFALDAFVERRIAADLFVGGLPQRLRAKQSCTEVLNWDFDPFLCSVNSLICTDTLLEKPMLLHWLVALWSAAITRLRSDSATRAQIASECRDLLRSLSLGGEQSLSAEYFDVVFGPDVGDKYELFVDRPCVLTDGLIEVAQRLIMAGAKPEETSESLGFLAGV